MIFRMPAISNKLGEAAKLRVVPEMCFGGDLGSMPPADAMKLGYMPHLVPKPEGRVICNFRASLLIAFRRGDRAGLLWAGEAWVDPAICCEAWYDDISTWTTPQNCAAFNHASVPQILSSI